ncbi:large ribosomal subunit protein mL53 [Rhineura floridana]|uniref:large ribosomal subunit protein mL53 n=1 Tax=Rhineura floridana TaxID=261503 RepID=UPI002AC88CB1|nr:large ribosomal subunit protein mL53 [Rhineura floridana]
MRERRPLFERGERSSGNCSLPVVPRPRALSFSCGLSREGKKMSFVVPKRAGVTLKQVKSILVTFCPFETNVESTRNFLQCLYTKKACASNTNCEVKTDVKHDGSEPVINITFADGDRLIMKGANLTIREMLSAFNSRCEAKELLAEKVQKKSS